MGDPVVTGMALCAGVGGLELGLQLAIPGYRCLCHVERESHAAAILLARMEEQIVEPAPVFAGDLADFDARPFAGLVDILSAGIPCQPYSVAGRQEGHADERALWPEFVRIVGECRPSLVFIENVPAFAQWFREPGEQLCELGYEIQSPLFLAAEDIGAPHKRERVFILAHTKGAGGSVFPGRYGETQGEGGREVSAGGICEGLRAAWNGRTNPTGGILADANQPGSQGHDAARRPMHEDLGSVRGAEGPTPQGGPGVALPPSRRQRELRQPPGCDGQPDGGDEAMADAEGPDRRSQLAEGGPQSRRAGPPGEREELGYAQGDDELRHPHGTHRQGEPVGGSSLPLFPPGPQSLDLWARVLAEAPTLEPALCKFAHGSPNRVDQLRALGNAVVPLVAAVAFLALTERLSGEP